MPQITYTVLTRVVGLTCFGWLTSVAAADDAFLFSDSHLHISNYVQRATDAHAYVEMMGTVVKRSTFFGIPLQQTWSHENTGKFAPDYYLESDAPLYYYSFVDTAVALAYRSLPPEEQQRLDPMITGFNPADMYAVDHIERTLLAFPNVFSGIGEFTIHKEFVSSKIAGGPPSLLNPALDRVLDFAGKVGLVVILHNDVSTPYSDAKDEPYMIAQLRSVFERHSLTQIIWAHCGLGRVIQPVENQLALLDRALGDAGLRHVSIDISWSETAKYLTHTPADVAATAKLINKYPTRFLFGSDSVAPKSLEDTKKVFDLYAPLWQALNKDASHKVRIGNYERLFDEARIKVRTWEKETLAKQRPPRREK